MPPAPIPPQPLSGGRKLRRWALVSLSIAALLLAISGEVASAYLWAVILGSSAVALFAVHRIAPDLARERYAPPTQGVDGPLLRWVRPMALATLVFALVDSGRWHLSASMPPAWRVVGVATFLIGLSVFVYAMSVNRFFSSVIRIQDDRGHHLIDQGPYARVRHPGYVGMLLVFATLPLALGSWWTFLPASLLLAFGVRRVTAEDRFLALNLPGYRDYAARVRYRLVPGLW